MVFVNVVWAHGNPKPNAVYCFLWNLEKALDIDPCFFSLTLHPLLAHTSWGAIVRCPCVATTRSQRASSALNIGKEGKSSSCSCSHSYLRSPAASLCVLGTGQKGRATAYHGYPSGTATMTCCCWLSLAFPLPPPASMRTAWVPQASYCLHAGPGGSQRYCRDDMVLTNCPLGR